MNTPEWCRNQIVRIIIFAVLTLFAAGGAWGVASWRINATDEEVEQIDGRLAAHEKDQAVLNDGFVKALGTLQKSLELQQQQIAFRAEMAKLEHDIATKERDKNAAEIMDLRRRIENYPGPPRERRP